MNLDALQQTLWRTLPEPPPQTAQDALASVSQTLVDGIRAFEQENLPQTQRHLEDALARLLIAMKRLDINAELAMERVLLRFSKTGMRVQRFVFYGDRVEIRVGEEIRGGWPIFSQDDYESAVALARTFGCDVQHADSRQLSIFAPAPSCPEALDRPAAESGPTRPRHRWPLIRRRATFTAARALSGARPSLRLIPGRAGRPDSQG